MRELADRLIEIPEAVAVTLGGSRASGPSHPDSDWDFGVYYRDAIRGEDVRALGCEAPWSSRGSGGRLVNGGTWLTLEGERVDLLYRDLDVVQHWLDEAEAGRYVNWPSTGSRRALRRGAGCRDSPGPRGRPCSLRYTVALRSRSYRRWRECGTAPSGRERAGGAAPDQRAVPEGRPTGRSRSCRPPAGGTMVLDTSSGDGPPNDPPPRHKEALPLTPAPLSSRPGRCSWCGRDVDTLDDRGRCVRCVTEAVGRAAALDSFDHGAVLCLAAGLDEVQLRHAQILVVDEAEGAMICDFVVRRREPDGGFAWHVPSSFLNEVT